MLVRPSYVLGGQGMEIAYNDRNITEFMRIINLQAQEHPILVDKYLMGREVEVDGVFDGEELLIPGNILSGVNDAVARAYTDGRLRMSVVADALLDRTNTGDNTPAFAEIALRPGHGATLHVLLKGGGSDNASRVVMLAPGAGWEGVKKVVLDCVREKAANACPPLIVGVGVGATFDKVAGLAKHALLREVGTPAASPQAAEREAELLSAINATGIGPAALGGGATALAVHLETAPCHIAALPVAVNMGCSAMRSASIELIDWGEGK